MFAESIYDHACSCGCVCAIVLFQATASCALSTSWTELVMIQTFVACLIASSEISDFKCLVHRSSVIASLTVSFFLVQQANRSGEGAMAAGTGMTQMFWLRLCCRCPGHGFLRPASGCWPDVSWLRLLCPSPQPLRPCDGGEFNSAVMMASSTSPFIGESLLLPFSPLGAL